MFLFLFHLVLDSTPHGRSLGRWCLELTTSTNLQSSDQIYLSVIIN